MTTATRRLWIGAIATFGLGDLVTTIAFLQLGMAAEANPIAAEAIGEFGLFALIPLKIGVFGVFYAIYRVSPSEISIGVPIGLALLGATVTVWNTYSSLFGVHLPF